MNVPVDLVADFAVEGRRVVGAYFAEGALGGLVLFFVRAMVWETCPELVRSLSEVRSYLDRRKEADDDGEGDEQFADDTDDVPEDVGRSFLAGVVRRRVHPFGSSGCVVDDDRPG